MCCVLCAFFFFEKKGGDKILLPPSAFDSLARLNVDYPMLFKLESHDKGTMTHSGVLEFTAEEGSCYIPFWMMQNLLIEEGALLTVTNVSLPKATFVKLQPQHVDFLDIHNPRAVLEHALRSFSCVTKGDVICIPYNKKNYHFMLKEVRPQDAACIIETDCNVDFDAPVGYKEPNWKDKTSVDDISTSSASGAGSMNPFCNLPKQSAHGGETTTTAPLGRASSSCPSPTSSSISGVDITEDNTSLPKKSSGIRIENGQIVRPVEGDVAAYGSARLVGPRTTVSTSMIAQRTGTTGVQKNAAIPVNAPEVDYWAINGGDGARLDGKASAALKDKDGKEVDIRKLREAALSAKTNGPNAEINSSTATTTQRQSRIGNKFSTRKMGVAYSGGGNKL
jgi:ubiquitin fusion degradation protein 1